ncbi:MAG: nucleoside triphosphate pyrophosphohydrolase [Clostridiales bacterium]|nr:nucleoside triphosphate pyrophosphohydrolase [Clostridiales bacterium]
MITVVGMGRKCGDLTSDGRAAIEQADVVVVKSQRTHAAETVAIIRTDAVYCDDLYEDAVDFDSLNDAIVNRLNGFGKKKVAFCVVGEGADDTTVQKLSGVKIIHGVSLQSAVLGNNMPAGTVVYTAQDLCSANCVFPQPTVVKNIDDKYIASEIQLRLLTAFDVDTEVVFCYKNTVKTIPLSELTKQRYDYQAALFIAPKPLIERQVFSYQDCADILTILCGENGCPWDRAQTHKSIIKNVIEEAYELADALEKEDTDHAVEELGDLLMQVLFHLEIGRNNGEYEPEAVYSGLSRKLIDRHPHVFGEVVANNAEESLSVWDAQKLKEHKIKGTAENVLDVPRGMSALMRSQKVQSRSSKGGYDFADVNQIVAKVKEELEEFLNADEANRDMEGGDLLFTCVNLLRYLGVDSETALINSTEKYLNRVVECERLLAERGVQLKDLTQQQFDEIWDEAKHNVG